MSGTGGGTSEKPSGGGTFNVTGGNGAVSAPGGGSVSGPIASRETGSAGTEQAPSTAPPAGGRAAAGETGSPAQESSSLPAPSLAQITRDLTAYGTKGFRPLFQGSDVLVVVHRTSSNGAPDVFAVFVGVDRQSEARAATLSDFSRLFQENATPLVFTLAEFSDSGGHLREVRTFPLGRHLVFESMKIVTIKVGADVPFAVSVTFQTQEGSDDRWVTFSHQGTSQLTLRQTLSRSAIVEDIDNDGYLDIVTRERGVEEGTGYETFLTWYKWNGRTFAEYKTTNIVRNLRAFLDRASTLLSEDQPVEFFRDSLPASKLAELRGKGLDTAAIFAAVFHLVPSTPDSPNSPILDLATVSRVIFPNIYEDPFTGQNSHGYRFPMTVRFVSSDDASHFYTAVVYMHRNPFVSPEFSFAAGSHSPTSARTP